MEYLILSTVGINTVSLITNTEYCARFSLPQSFYFFKGFSQINERNV